MPAVPTWCAARLLRVVYVVAALLAGGLVPQHVVAQRVTLPTDSMVGVTVRVQGDTTGSTAAAAAIVRSGAVSARTNDRGQAMLRLPVGTRMIVAAKLGYRPESVAVALRTGADAAISGAAHALPASPTATRE